MKPYLDILLSQLSKGDSKSFEKIFYMFYPRVFNLARRYHLSIENSKEITQQVFVIIWEKRSEIDPEKSFDGFVLSITRNLIINYLRKKAHLHAFVNYYLINGEKIDLVTENKIAFNELKEFLDHLINMMPSRRKEIFLLRQNDGLSYKEIAKKLMITESTVNTQMSKALDFLRQKIKQFYNL